MRISDWSSDVCSSDLTPEPDDFDREVSGVALRVDLAGEMPDVAQMAIGRYRWMSESWSLGSAAELDGLLANLAPGIERQHLVLRLRLSGLLTLAERVALRDRLESELAHARSEEHTSELQSLM